MPSLDMRNSDNPFEQVNQLNELLHELDERGLMLSLAAFAEDSLGELISAFMRPVGSTKRLLEGFNAPLGTFSSRIQATYSLGLISKEQYSNLEHLRKIRNEFSHSWQPLSFKDSKIAEHIKGITYSSIDDNYPETALEKVRSSLSSLLVELQSTTNQIQKNGRRISQIGTGLDSGVSGNIEEQISTCRSKFNEINEELAKTTGERQDFFRMLHKRWVIKFFRVISHAPKDRYDELLMEISGYVEGGVNEVKAILHEYLHPKSEV